MRTRGRVSQFASISGVAGGLLPIVEDIDPNRLPEYLSRAVALRRPENEGKDPSWIPEQCAPLAMMVARYDRELAAQVIQPDLENLGRVSLSYGGADHKTTRTLCALILIDPRKAVELIEALPEARARQSMASPHQERHPDRSREDALLARRRSLAARLRALPASLDTRSRVTLNEDSQIPGIWQGATIDDTCRP